jgi:hypothetical protein
MFDALLARGMTPNVTLSHFTLPQWFSARGGFADAANIPLFVAFAVKAVRTFGDQVKLWATFNEPVVRARVCGGAVCRGRAGVRSVAAVEQQRPESLPPKIKTTHTHMCVPATAPTNTTRWTHRSPRPAWAGSLAPTRPASSAAW